MPITYEVDRGTSLVRSRATGVVTLEELRQHVERLANEPALRGPLREIWDGRDVERFTLTAAEIRGLVEHTHLLRRRIGELCVAIVSNDDVIYGLGRLAQVAAEFLPVELRPFRDIDAAERWMASRAQQCERDAQR